MELIEGDVRVGANKFEQAGVNVRMANQKAEDFDVAFGRRERRDQLVDHFFGWRLLSASLQAVNVGVVDFAALGDVSSSKIWTH